MTEKKEPDYTESTRPGTAYSVFEAYKKSQLDASGREPIIIKPDPVESKKKKSIN